MVCAVLEHRRLLLLSYLFMLFMCFNNFIVRQSTENFFSCLWFWVFIKYKRVFFFYYGNRFKYKARNIYKKNHLSIFMHAVLVLRNIQTNKMPKQTKFKTNKQIKNKQINEKTEQEELKTQENKLFWFLSNNIYTKNLGSSYLSFKKII